MSKRGCIPTVGMIIGGLALFGACGAILDGADTAMREATRTPKPTVASTATVMPSATIAPVKCDISEWRAMANDVFAKWGEVRGIDALDALIQRYDTLALPECDSMNDALLQFDEHMRMGMANQRTAMMVDQADAQKYVGQTLMHYMQAKELLKELNNVEAE